MRNLISICLLLACSLFASLSAAQDQNAALWKNQIATDTSWFYPVPSTSILLNARKNPSAGISELTYSNRLKYAVTVTCALTPINRFTRTDGCGLNITDANGANYFLTMRDDYEAGIATKDSTGLTKYLAFVGPTDVWKVQLGTIYAVSYYVSPTLITYRISGGPRDVVLQANVNVAFPVTLKMVSQRASTNFGNVRLTSDGDETYVAPIVVTPPVIVVPPPVVVVPPVVVTPVTPPVVVVPPPVVVKPPVVVVPPVVVKPPCQPPVVKPPVVVVPPVVVKPPVVVPPCTGGKDDGKGDGKGDDDGKGDGKGDDGKGDGKGDCGGKDGNDGKGDDKGDSKEPCQPKGNG